MSDTVCRLCKGTGKETTGLIKNGNPCVRCGGYGTIPSGCDNERGLTNKEKEHILKYER